eukprot:scaffold3114_cov114-Isochrysis_galbana.AAC.4
MGLPEKRSPPAMRKLARRATSLPISSIDVWGSPLPSPPTMAAPSSPSGKSSASVPSSASPPPAKSELLPPPESSAGRTGLAAAVHLPVVCTVQAPALRTPARASPVRARAASGSSNGSRTTTRRSPLSPAPNQTDARSKTPRVRGAGATGGGGRLTSLGAPGRSCDAMGPLPATGAGGMSFPGDPAIRDGAALPGFANSDRSALFVVVAKSESTGGAGILGGLGGFVMSALAAFRLGGERAGAAAAVLISRRASTAALWPPITAGTASADARAGKRQHAASPSLRAKAGASKTVLGEGRARGLSHAQRVGAQEGHPPVSILSGRTATGDRCPALGTSKREGAAEQVECAAGCHNRACKDPWLVLVTFKDPLAVNVKGRVSRSLVGKAATRRDERRRSTPHPAHRFCKSTCLARRGRRRGAGHQRD